MKAKHRLKFLLLSVMLVSCNASQALKETSENERLQSRFEEFKKEGWDVNSDLLWGYFFKDPDEEKLRPLSKHLEAANYRLVDVAHFDGDKDERAGYVLHVEKVETHSAISLAKRNQEFRDLAAKFAVESYDGWDVGKVK